MRTEQPIAFMSYAHLGDDAGVTSLRDRLEREVTVQLGEPFHIFQDRLDIQWGEAWKRRIESSLDRAALLIPILTPAFFRSPHCRAEVERFLAREARLGASELILPVYYVTSREIEDEGMRAGDDLARALADRQLIDCRDLRLSGFGSEPASRKLAELGAAITRGLTTPDRAPAVAANPRRGDPLANLAAHGVGLVRTFRDWAECQDEILQEVTQSASVRVFVQIGKSVLSGAAVIYNALERSRPDADIRILHAGLSNPYLGERSAVRRNSDYQEWQEDVAYAMAVGERLQARLGSRLQIRQHHEGYIWRLFIFDDIAYVQPYLHQRDNAGQAPVLKFVLRGDLSDVNANPNAMWYLFSNYFDLKWEECAPLPATLADRVPADEVASVVAILERGGYKIFVVPKRFVDRPGEELPFHSVGGKRRPGEDWLVALQREAREEIGVNVEVKSSIVTREVTTAAEFSPLHLADYPRPYCIYRRTRDVDPEVPEPTVTWIVGYEAEIPADTPLEPHSEIAAILVLSPALVRRTARERITYSEIRDSRDGSHVVVAADVAFDWTRIAVPTGLAAVSVLRWRR